MGRLKLPRRPTHIIDGSMAEQLHLIGYDLGDQGQDWLERALMVLHAEFEARLAAEARLDELEAGA